jgi:hypothetical protein
MYVFQEGPVSFTNLASPPNLLGQEWAVVPPLASDLLLRL